MKVGVKLSRGGGGGPTPGSSLVRGVHFRCGQQNMLCNRSRAAVADASGTVGYRGRETKKLRSPPYSNTDFTLRHVWIFVFVTLLGTLGDALAESALDSSARTWGAEVKSQNQIFHNICASKESEEPGQLGEPIRILRSKHGVFCFSTRNQNSELPPFTYDAKITDFTFYSEIACLAGLNKTQLTKMFKLSTAEGSAERSIAQAFGDSDKEVLFLTSSMPGFSTWRSKVTS